MIEYVNVIIVIKKFCVMGEKEIISYHLKLKEPRGIYGWFHRVEGFVRKLSKLIMQKDFTADSTIISLP